MWVRACAHERTSILEAVRRRMDLLPLPVGLPVPHVQSPVEVAFIVPTLDQFDAGRTKLKRGFTIMSTLVTAMLDAVNHISG